MNRLVTDMVALVCLAAAGTAQALDYDETASGDISDDRLNPTVLTFATGTNSISGTIQSGDRDYFTFAVPSGWTLGSIVHEAYDSTDFRAFIGLQSGTMLTEPPVGTDAANLLGYTLFGLDTVGSEIIDDLAASGSSFPSAAGFDAPLAAGAYTFWVQQTGSLTTYSFDFTLTPVPEPEQWAFLLAGGLLLATRMRRKIFS